MISDKFRRSLIRGASLVGGLLVIEFILFGPSLVGRKILLPLDVLPEPGTYLSPAQSAMYGLPRDPILSDPVLEVEPDRRYAVSEVRAGRLPLWSPHQYCGQPFLAANITAVFSPFRLLDYLWPGTLVIAWDHVLKTLVAGIGTYFFFRRAMGMRFLPALFGGWIWPLCGYYVQWAGHMQSAVASWLPWIFLFTDATLRNAWGFGGIGLALATGLSLVSGHAGTAAQVLFADGCFFLWRAFDLHGWATFKSPGPAAVILAWALGTMLSAPQSLPTADYVKNSHRISDRMRSISETPSVGLIAIPQLVLPDFNGATRDGAIYFGGSRNEPESASTGYVGLITALVLVPLGLFNLRRRGWLVFCIALAIIGMGQIVDVPGLKQLYQSFPFNTLRDNRMALATGWAILIAGIIGLETLHARGVHWRNGFWLAAALPIVLGVWSLIRAFVQPQAMRSICSRIPSHLVPHILERFRQLSFGGFALCMAAAAIWLTIAIGFHRRRSFAAVIGILSLMELIIVSYNVYPQGDPALYYPPQPILDDLARAPVGRVCGVDCLQACLTETAGLLDVRGYDGADPQRLTDLAGLTQPHLFDNDADASGYLATYFPSSFPSAITRLMNLRYLIFTGTPPPGRRTLFRSDGYWVYEDRHCLPRVFIPRTVNFIDDQSLVLHLLDSPDFDPAMLAYAESPAAPPMQPALGEAHISGELPSHVTIEFNMQTPGVIVLSDAWDEGWHARINGAETPVLRANYMFRGVMVPSGKGTLQFDYEPAGFYQGLKCAAVAGIILLAWLLVAVRGAWVIRKCPAGNVQ